LSNVVIIDIDISIMFNAVSLTYMVIKITVPNMTRKENGKGIIYDMTMPIEKYTKSRSDCLEGNRFLFILLSNIRLSLDLKPHTILDKIIRSRTTKNIDITYE
jgi:hypothetical protein